MNKFKRGESAETSIKGNNIGLGQVKKKCAVAVTQPTLG